jgi:hypothetical protein
MCEVIYERCFDANLGSNQQSLSMQLGRRSLRMKRYPSGYKRLATRAATQASRRNDLSNAAGLEAAEAGLF